MGIDGFGAVDEDEGAGFAFGVVDVGGEIVDMDRICRWMIGDSLVETFGKEANWNENVGCVEGDGLGIG